MKRLTLMGVNTRRRHSRNQAVEPKVEEGKKEDEEEEEGEKKKKKKKKKKKEEEEEKEEVEEEDNKHRVLVKNSEWKRPLVRIELVAG